MATLAQAKSELLRLLKETEGQDTGDPIEGTTSDADTLLDAICAGLDAIVIRCFKQSVLSIAGGEADASLPDDLIEVEGVLDNTLGVFLPKAIMESGQSLGSTAWLQYPSGSITFSTALGDDGATVYYSSSWTKPEAEDDVIEAPRYVMPAVIYFAASHVLLGKSASAAELAQFKSKVDAGNPEHLPHLLESREMLRRFNDALERAPMMQKGNV